MSIVQSSIQTKLLNRFSPAHLEVLNESHMHSVPPNSETHFKVVLVANEFRGMMKVKRHQAIYAELAEELQGPVHALALHLYTPQEWQEKSGGAPDSPLCASKSK